MFFHQANSLELPLWRPVFDRLCVNVLSRRLEKVLRPKLSSRSRPSEKGWRIAEERPRSKLDPGWLHPHQKPKAVQQLGVPLVHLLLTTRTDVNFVLPLAGPIARGGDWGYRRADGCASIPLSKQTQTCFNTAGFQSPLQFAVLFNDVDFVVQPLQHGEIDVYQATGAIQTYFPTKSEG